MNYDIALVMVPPWEARMPPLGIAYIAEYLKYRGFSPKIFDFNLELYRNISPRDRSFWEITNINSMHPTEITRKMFNIFQEEIEVLIDRIISSSCELVGFSVNITSIGLAAKIAAVLKRRDKNKIVIFGGTGCFWEIDRRLIFPNDLWAIDAFVVGDGEIPLAEMIENFKKHKDFTGIKGVISNQKDFLKPSPSFHTPEIDSLPFPTFSGFELELYKEKLIPLLTSRGCIGRCSFCIDHLMCGIYRCRSPEKILEEIEYHINTHKISNFSFNDLICNGNLKRLEKLCDLIIHAGLKIVWGSYAMIRKDMSVELFKKMHDSGCIYLCYGLESGSNQVLKGMNKFYRREEAQELLRKTHKAGIRTGINIIVGFPRETVEDFEETLSFIRNNKDYIYEITNISSFVVMPKARLGRYPQEYGLKLPAPGEDLKFHEDENGLNLAERARRVRKTIFLVSHLEIGSIIINQSGIDDYAAKDAVALVFCPPARIDLPSLRFVNLYSYLKNKRINPLTYDFNVKLFQIIPQDSRNLWEYHKWHLWSFNEELSSIFNRLEEEIFTLCEELISLKTNKVCFLITRENFLFSLKIAFLLKKYNPNFYNIFTGDIFTEKKSLELVPPEVVDIFIYTEEERTLLKILNSINNNDAGVSNTVLYRDGRYIARKRISSDKNGELSYSTDLSDFDLEAYTSLKLPLSFVKETASSFSLPRCLKNIRQLTTS